MSHAITRFDIYILLNKSQTRNCCETNIPLEFKSTLGYFKVGTFQISRPERIALISSLTGDKEKNILGKTASFYGPLDVYSDFIATYLKGTSSILVGTTGAPSAWRPNLSLVFS